MIIYKTTNINDKKIYVGQDLNDNSKYLGSGMLLKRAISKYGKENFKKEPIAWCYTKEHLNFLEKLYVNLLNSKFPNGYNLTEGGTGGKTYLNPEDNPFKRIKFIGDKNPSRRPEVREKIRLSKLGNKNPMFGKHFTKEHCMKISESNTGQHSQLKGRKRPNMSIALTGRHLSEVHRNHISEGLKKCNFNKDSERLSCIAKKRWETRKKRKVKYDTFY